MVNTAKYVVDTCSFTTLRRLYPQDVFPGAWQAVTEMADNGVIISSHEVLLELENQEDIITEWARKNQSIFKPLLFDIQQKASDILSKYPNLLDLHNSKSNADPFLIATAIIYKCSIVTEELPAGLGAKLLKIPNICKELNIDYIHLLDLFRIEKVQLEMKT